MPKARRFSIWKGLILLGILVLVLGIGISLKSIYTGYVDCPMIGLDKCAVPYGWSGFDQKYMPLNANGENPFKNLSINYSASTCSITLNNNAFGAPGDACDGVHCDFGTFTTNLVESPYGPVCPIGSQTDWIANLAGNDGRDCCLTNPDWTINQIIGIGSITFNIVKVETNSNSSGVSGGNGEGSVNNSIGNNSSCHRLYYFDDNSNGCSQKEFCGTFAYQGLRTFKSLSDCESKYNELHPANKGFNLLKLAVMPYALISFGLIGIGIAGMFISKRFGK